MRKDANRHPRNGAGKQGRATPLRAANGRVEKRSLPKQPSGVSDLGKGTPSAVRAVLRALQVGIDVVRVGEVAAALNRFGDAYIRRTFSTHEAAYCRAGAPQVAAQRFAARFAAKEAVIKALQPSASWTDYRSIEVRRDRKGRCHLRLHRSAAALAERRGIEHLALSLSHDGDVAAAVVVAVPSIYRPRAR
jgi:holo-[acyl-carrier protein] synthase